MTILLPLVLILTGSSIYIWAGKTQSLWIHLTPWTEERSGPCTLAGPLTNILLALHWQRCFETYFCIYPYAPMEVDNIFFMMITYNVALAILNLFPIPPLTGPKYFALLLPERLLITFSPLDD